MAEIWPNLTTNEKDYYLNQQAGANQTVNLAAVLSNFGNVEKALTTALNSNGSALQENSAYMESLEAKSQAVKAAFQELALDVIDSQLVKSILDLTKSFLELADSGIGQFIIKFGLVSGLLTGGIALFAKFGSGISSTIQSFKGLITAAKSVGSLARVFTTAAGASAAAEAGLISAGTAATGASAGFAALTASAAPIALALAGIAAVGYGVYKAFRALNPTLEDYSKRVSEIEAQLDTQFGSGSEYETISHKAGQLTFQEKERLEVLKEQIEQYKEQGKQAEAQAIESSTEYKQLIEQQQVVSTITDEERNRLTILKAQTEELLAQQAAAKKDYYEKWAKDYTAEYEYAVIEGGDISPFGQTTGFKSTSELTKDFDALNKSIADAGNAFETFLNKDAYLQALNTIIAQNAEQYNNLKQAMLAGVDFGDKTAEVEGYIRQYESLISIVAELSKETENHAGNVEEADAATIKAKQTAQDLIKAMNEEKGAVDTTTAAFRKLVAQEIIFNNTELSYQDKVEALRRMALEAGAAATAIADISTVLSIDQDAVRSLMNQGKTKAEAFKIVAEQGQTEFLQSYWKQLEGLISNGGEEGGGGGGSKTTTDPELERLKDIVSLRKSELSLLQAQDAPTADLIAKQKEIQNALHDQAEYLRSIGGAQADINALSTEWWTIQENILSQQKEMLDTVVDYQTTLASRNINVLQKQLDAVNDAIDAVNERYDAQVDALEKQNDALEEQIKLEQYLEALAQAKSLRKLVYKDGQFQYVQDEDAISEAQADLNSYQRELELERQKELIEEQRNAELADLESQKDALQQQIDMWQSYSDGWTSLREDYEFQEKALAAAQAQAVVMESEIWTERISNLQNFAQQYSSIIGSLNGLSLQGIGSMGIPASGGGNTSVSTTNARNGYWYGDINADYAQLMLNSASMAEFEYWAQQRVHKIQAAGLDLAESGYQTNEEIMAAWLENLEKMGLTYEQILSGQTGLSPAEGPASYGEYYVGDYQDYAYQGQIIDDRETAKLRYVGERLGRSDVAQVTDAYLDAVLKEAEEWAQLNYGDKNELAQRYDNYYEQQGRDNWEDLVRKGEYNPYQDFVLNAGKAGYAYNAKGTLSAKAGLSVVGENGPEMRVLNSGDGIIPADITRNLWNWGSLSPANLLNNIQNGVSSMVMNISNIALPNVTNPAEFVSGLKELAFQYAYKRA